MCLQQLCRTVPVCACSVVQGSGPIASPLVVQDCGLIAPATVAHDGGAHRVCERTGKVMSMSFVYAPNRVLTPVNFTATRCAWQPINSPRGCTSPNMLKKLINQPDDVVYGSLEGLALPIPICCTFICAQLVTTQSTPPSTARSASSAAAAAATNRSTPAMSGVGMLDAACPGGVFTSPTPDQYLRRLMPSTAAPAPSSSSRTSPAACFN